MFDDIDHTFDNADRSDSLEPSYTGQIDDRFRIADPSHFNIPVNVARPSQFDNPFVVADTKQLDIAPRVAGPSGFNNSPMVAWTNQFNNLFSVADPNQPDTAFMVADTHQFDDPSLVADTNQPDISSTVANNQPHEPAYAPYDAGVDHHDHNFDMMIDPALVAGNAGPNVSTADAHQQLTHFESPLFESDPQKGDDAWSANNFSGTAHGEDAYPHNTTDEVGSPHGRGALFERELSTHSGAADAHSLENNSESASGQEPDGWFEKVMSRNDHAEDGQVPELETIYNTVEASDSAHYPSFDGSSRGLEDGIADNVVSGTTSDVEDAFDVADDRHVTSDEDSSDDTYMPGKAAHVKRIRKSREFPEPSEDANLGQAAAVEPNAIYPPWSGTVTSIADMKATKERFRSQRWIPETPDLTLPDPADPDYGVIMRGHAVRLYDAMNSHDPSRINDTINGAGKRGNRTIKAAFVQKWVECQAWELVAAAIDLHTKGSAMLPEVDIANKEDRSLCFADRISAMEKTLTEWKATCDDVCSGHKLLQVVHAPNSCSMRKQNNKRNNEHKRVIIDIGKNVSKPPAAHYGTAPTPGSANAPEGAAPTLQWTQVQTGAPSAPKSTKARGIKSKPKSTQASTSRTTAPNGVVKRKRVMGRPKTPDEPAIYRAPGNRHLMTATQLTVWNVKEEMKRLDDGDEDVDADAEGEDVE